MRVAFSSEGLGAEAGYRQSAESLVRIGLGRFATAVDRVGVEVRVLGEGGAREFECTIELESFRAGLIRQSDRDRDFGVAMGRVVERTSRAMDRSLALRLDPEVRGVGSTQRQGVR
jgi:hypothetical protein